jgi:hypothetical protein
MAGGARGCSTTYARGPRAPPTPGSTRSAGSPPTRWAARPARARRACVRERKRRAHDATRMRVSRARTICPHTPASATSQKQAAKQSAMSVGCGTGTLIMKRPTDSSAASKSGSAGRAGAGAPVRGTAGGAVPSPRSGGQMRPCSGCSRRWRGAAACTPGAAGAWAACGGCAAGAAGSRAVSSSAITSPIACCCDMIWLSSIVTSGSGGGALAAGVSGAETSGAAAADGTGVKGAVGSAVYTTGICAAALSCSCRSAAARSSDVSAAFSRSRPAARRSEASPSGSAAGPASPCAGGGASSATVISASIAAARLSFCPGHDASV